MRVLVEQETNYDKLKRTLGPSRKEVKKDDSSRVFADNRTNSEKLLAAIDEEFGDTSSRYSVSRYGRWLYTIIDNKTGLNVRKPGKENDSFAYDEKGKANFLTFKKKEEAEAYIQKNLQEGFGKDTFFSQDTCDRCGGSLDGGRTMSMFNDDCICMKCKEEERKHKDYKKAQDAEINQVRQGNYNYKGIGLPNKNEALESEVEDKAKEVQNPVYADAIRQQMKTKKVKDDVTQITKDGKPKLKLEESLFEDYEEPNDIILVIYKDETEDYPYNDEYQADGHFSELEQMSAEALDEKGIIGYAHLCRNDEDKFIACDAYYVKPEADNAVEEYLNEVNLTK